MPLKGVKSNKKDAPWYSPQAVQIGVNVADLAAQLYLEQTKQWGKIEKAGLSMICRRVPLIFCRKAESTSPDLGFDWHVGCFSYGKTAGIAWPVTLRSVPCHHDMQSWTVDFHNPDRTPRMLTILTLKNIYARQFEWRSAAWLRQSFPFADQDWQASVRAVVDSREDVPIAKAMAESGWFDYDLSELQPMAEDLDITLPAGASLFTTLKVMTMEVLGCSEDTALEKLKVRLKEDDDVEGLEELLQVDEAAAVLGKTDVEALLKEKEKRTAEKETKSDFGRQYAEARSELRKRGAAASSSSSNRSRARRPRLPAPEILTHEDAKTMIPPGAYIWRAFAHEAWEGRSPPKKTFEVFLENMFDERSIARVGYRPVD